MLLLLYGEKQTAGFLRNGEECQLEVWKDNLEGVESLPLAQLDGQIGVEIAGLVPLAHALLFEGSLHLPLRVSVQPLGGLHAWGEGCAQHRAGVHRLRDVEVQSPSQGAGGGGCVGHDGCGGLRLDIESLQANINRTVKRTYQNRYTIHAHIKEKTALRSGLGCHCLDGDVGGPVG